MTAPVKLEPADLGDGSHSVQQYTCDICGFEINHEKIFTDHVKICRDIETSPNRLDIEPSLITVKIEPSEQDISNAETLDDPLTVDPRYDINFVKVECTDTSVCYAGKPSASLKQEATQEERYNCYKCDYTTTNQSLLDDHKKLHPADDPYKCDTCDYATPKLRYLNAHKLIHENRYKCSDCGYVCARNDDLTRHFRTHTRERPFKCSLCDYASAQHSNLRAHMRTHTGQKPFKCTLCDYASARKGALDIHLRRHAGDKPFKCNMCDYASAASGGLSRHMFRHK